MNIYEIGVEKCVDGVWGRWVNGRFYNLITNFKSVLLSRVLDTASEPNDYYATLLDDFRESVSYECKSSVEANYKEYTPKHIKDLENLKRGDIVWVESATRGCGHVWSPVVYLNSTTTSGYEWLLRKSIPEASVYLLTLKRL
jgi:hypothetical protein